MGVDQLVTGGDVDNPVVESLTSDSVNTGVLESDWVTDAGNFDTLQAAIDAADGTTYHVIAPPETYEESLTIPNGVTVEAFASDGQSRIEPPSGNANAAVLNGGARLEGFRVSSGDTRALDFQSSNAVVSKCRFSPFGSKVARIDNTGNRLLDNYINSGDVNLTSDSDRSVVVANTWLGTANDSGTDNEVSGNS